MLRNILFLGSSEAVLGPAAACRRGSVFPDIVSDSGTIESISFDGLRLSGSVEAWLPPTELAAYDRLSDLPDKQLDLVLLDRVDDLDLVSLRSLHTTPETLVLCRRGDKQRLSRWLPAQQLVAFEFRGGERPAPKTEPAWLQMKDPALYVDDAARDHMPKLESAFDPALRIVAA